MEEKPDCYKKPLAYDATACDRCKYYMNCYVVFLKYLEQEEKGLWG